MSNPLSALLALLALLGSPVASAIQIDFASISLGGNNYRYEYQILNDGSLGTSMPVRLLDLEFDPLLFDESSLTNASASSLAADWTQTFLASAPGVAAVFDLSATNQGIAVGTRLDGFAVEFHWLGNGIPGGQAFEIYDPDSFALLAHGVTTPVPEPNMWAMMVIAWLATLLLGRQVRDPSPRRMP
jgi:hypothetical protein